MDINWPYFLANVILIIHVGYILVVVGGLFVILLGGLLRWEWVRNFWFRVIHFVMMGIVVVETAFGWTCPLTTWEVDLRQASGIALEIPVEVANGQVTKVKYEPRHQDFVGRCCHKVLFLDLPEWAFTTLYYTLGAVILAGLFFVPPRWPWRSRSTAHSLVEPSHVPTGPRDQ